LTKKVAVIYYLLALKRRLRTLTGGWIMNLMTRTEMLMAERRAERRAFLTCVKKESFLQIVGGLVFFALLGAILVFGLAM